MEKKITVEFDYMEATIICASLKAIIDEIGELALKYPKAVLRFQSMINKIEDELGITESRTHTHPS